MLRRCSSSSASNVRVPAFPVSRPRLQMLCLRSHTIAICFSYNITPRLGTHGTTGPPKRVQKAEGEDNRQISSVQEVSNCAVEWHAAGEADPLSQGTRSWLQLLGHLMVSGEQGCQQLICPNSLACSIIASLTIIHRVNCMLQQLHN